MFARLSTDIGSDLPLWAVQDDQKPGVGTVTDLMGGWTKAYAKQYNLGMMPQMMIIFFDLTDRMFVDITASPLCGGTVDLDSFTA